MPHFTLEIADNNFNLNLIAQMPYIYKKYPKPLYYWPVLNLISFNFNILKSPHIVIILSEYKRKWNDISRNYMYSNGLEVPIQKHIGQVFDSQ